MQGIKKESIKQKKKNQQVECWFVDYDGLWIHVGLSEQIAVLERQRWLDTVK